MKSNKHRLPLVLSSLLALGLSFAWIRLAAASLDALEVPTTAPNTVGHSLTSVDGRLYLFGGGGFTTTYESNQLWEFHPAGNNWSQVEVTGTLPTPRRGHAAVPLGHELFVFGGYNSTEGVLNDIWAYDPKTSQWRQALQDTPLPGGRANHSAVSSPDGYVYLYGGSSNPPVGLDTMWRYDPTTGQWTVVSMENPSGERYGLYVTMANGKVYLVGGSQEDPTAPFLQSYSSSAWEFTNVTPTNPGPARRYDHAGATHGNDIYIFGGASITDSHSLSDAWKFNTSNNTWTRLPNLPEPMSEFSAAVITGTVSGAQSLSTFKAAGPSILLSRGMADFSHPAEHSYVFDGTTYYPIIDTLYLYLPLVTRR